MQSRGTGNIGSQNVDTGEQRNTFISVRGTREQVLPLGRPQYLDIEPLLVSEQNYYCCYSAEVVIPVNKFPSNTSLEEPTTSITSQYPVVFSAGCVPTHHT